ncbi:MAG: hypothetical protein R3211_08665 [Balneolaceae bacterium]|nr:hypothetical protein [Balneolaceae bacterium]
MSDKEKELLSKPFVHILYAVQAYNAANQTYPSSFAALKNMTADEWKEACNLSGNEDIPSLDHFAAAETQINRVKNGLRIDFKFRKTSYNRLIEETLHSPFFDTSFNAKYGINVTIEKGYGYMVIPDNNALTAKITLQDYSATLRPVQRVKPVKQVNIITEEVFSIKRSGKGCR